MSKVFVLDTDRKPLQPCHPAVARKLLKSGQAAVLRRFPFVIILKHSVAEPNVHPLRLKIDPGSKITGLAIVNDGTGEVVFAAELEHRGETVKQNLESRRSVRRNRRHRKTRYRKSRFRNRRRPTGWLPPSLESRVANIVTWVGRLTRFCPVTAISLELVRFDLQLIENADIAGVGYQQGELAGYETKQYLLEKFHRTCVYCQITGVPLEVEHIIPRSRGGSNRVSNLVIACHSCNQLKGNQTAAEFGFPQISALAKAPLRDAAAVNTTRWALFERLQRFALPVETGGGGLTKFNRTRLGMAKGHWQDAACVGVSTPETLEVSKVKPWRVKACGHGTRRRCRPGKFGFPVGHAPKAKFFQGFQTGDLVRAVIPNGKFKGIHTGRIAIRFRPSFRLHGFDVHPKYLTKLAAADGYEYKL